MPNLLTEFIAANYTFAPNEQGRFRIEGGPTPINGLCTVAELFARLENHRNCKVMFSPAVHVGGLKNEHVLNGGRVTAIVIDIDAKHLPEGFAPREVVAGIHAQFPRAWGLYSNGVSLF